MAPHTRHGTPIAAAAVTLFAGAFAFAGPADVVSAIAECRGEVCDLSVSVRHADEGWDHYADAFLVVDADGTVLGKRVLRHPHVDEQPFTRSLPGVHVPAELTSVRIRAHDSVHGYGGAELEVDLGRGDAE